MNDVTLETLWLVLIVVTVPLLLGSIISLLVSLLLGAMQIQEQTTTFLLRLLVISAMLFFSWDWIETRILKIFYNCFVVIAS